MGAVATKPAGALLAPEADRPASRLFEPAGGELSLEDAILGSWGELERDGVAGCPVCAGRITLAHGCEDCGAELF